MQHHDIHFPTRDNRRHWTLPLRSRKFELVLLSGRFAKRKEVFLRLHKTRKNIANIHSDSTPSTPSLVLTLLTLLCQFCTNLVAAHLRADVRV